MQQISKAQLISLAESAEVLDYLGEVIISGEHRLYYRTTGVPGEKPNNYIVVYIVA